MRVSHPLPTLSKKLIYIDQNALSDMMKALNPATDAYQKGRVRPEWARLFARLFRLVHLQLIVCPSSCFHDHESDVSPFHSALEQVWKTLSGGVEFDGKIDVWSAQAGVQARLWQRGEDVTRVELDRADVLRGDPNCWLDLLRIDVDVPPLEGLIESLREHREAVPDRMARILEGWATQDLSFDETYDQEARSWGPAMLKSVAQYQQRLLLVYAGMQQLSAEVAVPPDPVMLHEVIRRVLEGEGVPREQSSARADEYLLSEAPLSLPCNRTSALLYAAIARKVRAGQRSFRPSTMTDVDIISSLAPYCDAMFIDRAMLALLRESPIPERLELQTRFFSTKTLAYFEHYLEQIEAAATEEHLRLVEAIYGPAWGPEEWAAHTFGSGESR